MRFRALPVVLLLAVSLVGVRADAPIDPCATLPAPNLTTIDGWIGYLAAHEADVSLVADDGRGHVVTHRPDQAQPLASAVKVVHLAAYARAVAQGRVSPDEPVRVGDWERWYLPDTDGGAHPQALDLLGIPRDRVHALDPGRTVPLGRLAEMVIRVSDNAATDFLRDRLGDEALRRAAADAGWPDLDLPSVLGGVVALYAPELAPPPSTPRVVRGPAEWALARRYVNDPALRATLSVRPSPPDEVDRNWADAAAAASATQLAALHRAIGTGSFGPGAELARDVLEQDRFLPPGVTAIGYKGGSLNGVITGGMVVHREDGTTATAVLLVRRMSSQDGAVAGEFAVVFRRLLVDAVTDPLVAAKLRCG